jgi:hypothetical protein
MLAPLAVGGFLLIAAHGNASALTRGETAEGLGYATGGVTVSELKTLAAEKDHYDLWVTTAAKGSGAFLSDVQLKITDKQRHVVLDTTMIGPWLFVDLAPGTYTIEAKFKDQSLKRTTWVGRGDHHQAILYFDSPARVSPDWVSPFARSPYAAN